MSDLSLDTIIQRSDNFVAAAIEGDTVMMNVESGHYFGLDDIGTAAWEALQQPQSIAQIRDQLLQQYDADETQCGNDLIDFFGELLAQDIVHVVA